MKKFLGTFILCVVMLSGCAAGDITVGQIPPPPPRPTPPVVALPAQQQPAHGGDVAAHAGEVFTLSFAHNVGPVHPRGYMIEVFAEPVEERSDGRLVINVFSGGELGSDAQVMEQILDGTVDMTAILSPNMSHIVPELALFDMPYLFFNAE